MQKPYYSNSGIIIYYGDCLEVMSQLSVNSVDAIVCDPPYGLNFMGKAWDRGVPGIPFWVEALRVSKPGVYLVAFGGTRTYHRLACAIEDAGWEVRDCLMWLYGTGFPKSMDVSKALDKAAGVEREVVGIHRRHGGGSPKSGSMSGSLGVGAELPLTVSTTDAAKQWEGWGTGLKPSWEPVLLARKPVAGTVARNVLKYGTGGINIDACRLKLPKNDPQVTLRKGKICKASGKNNVYASGMGKVTSSYFNDKGRWPANLMLDEASAGMLDEQNNGVSRFFYCAKAPRSERGEGNDHPTVKPLSLMQYLCKLVIPENGIVLDPFMGSGSTLIAASRLGREVIGIDINEKYCEIASNRLNQEMPLFNSKRK